jgi:FG-GAP repeat protein
MRFAMEANMRKATLFGSGLAILGALALATASCGGGGGGGGGDAVVPDMAPGEELHDGPVPDGPAAAFKFPLDFNGDGYDDVAVGAPQGMLAGYVNVYFGSATGVDTTADGTLLGATNGDQFGAAVAGAGDFNGDGYPDLVVGSPASSGGVGVNAGRADVFFGAAGASFDTTPDWTATGTAHAKLGASVAWAGDVNGDGHSDIIVGAPGDGNTVTGQALVFFGADGLPDPDADGTLVAAAAGTSFGFSVSGGADLNNDGFSDVIVGAPNDGAGGYAYVYFGGSGTTMDATSDGGLAGQSGGEFFGGSVQAIGDANGDAFGDLAVGARLNSDLATSQGRVYVFLGSGAATFNTNADGVLDGSGSEFFGDSLGSGDFNGDGLRDLSVGTSFGSRVVVFFGKQSAAQFDETPDRVMMGPNIQGIAGTVGDVNGDGFDEVAVGAPGSNQALLFYGGNPLDASTADATLSGSASESFGRAVAWSVPASDPRTLMCLPPG